MSLNVSAERVSVITMSKGPGTIESRIADLFAATRDRALSIDEITDNAYGLGGARPTRAQRLSATRAAHRLLRRVHEMHERTRRLRREAHTRTKAALCHAPDAVELRRISNDVAIRPGLDRAGKRADEVQRIGIWGRFVRADRRGYLKTEDDFWCTSSVKGRLYFHPPDVPVAVWAVSIGRSGITWTEVDVVKVTERNVMVRYAGETARLDRRGLWLSWAWWRGVMFVSSRTGRIAEKLDRLWQERYAASGGPAVMQMPLATALQLLGLPPDADYTKADVIAAFRRAAKKAHPDAGGTAEMFRVLVEARDRLLAAIGTSAPPPKPPTYAPAGARVVYRQASSRRPRLGSTRYLT